MNNNQQTKIVSVVTQDSSGEVYHAFTSSFGKLLCEHHGMTDHVKIFNYSLCLKCVESIIKTLRYRIDLENITDENLKDVASLHQELSNDDSVYYDFKFAGTSKDKNLWEPGDEIYMIKHLIRRLKNSLEVSLDTGMNLIPPDARVWYAVNKDLKFKEPDVHI